MNDAARQAFLQARCGSVGGSDVPNIIRRIKTGYGASRANLMALKAVERLKPASRSRNLSERRHGPRA